MVREVYRSANVLAQEMDDEEENHQRGANRGVTKPHSLHAVFLLHIKLPGEEVDHGLEPLKSSVLFRVRLVSFTPSILLHTYSLI